MENSMNLTKPSVKGKKTAFITGVRIFFPSVYACIILSSTVKIPFQSTITIIFNKLNK